MTLWRQRHFACVYCGTLLAHDRMYAHNLFQCAERPTKARLLAQGRVYEPVAEKNR